MLIAVVWIPRSLVSTGIGVVIVSSSTKPDSGVTPTAVVMIVTKDTDSRFGKTTVITPSVEPFLVTQ